MIYLIPLIISLLLAAGPGPVGRLGVEKIQLWPLAFIAALGMAVFVIRGPGLILASAMIVGVAGWKVRSVRRHAREAKAAEATAQLLGSVAGDLRAGATPYDAIVHLTHDAPAALRRLCTLAAHRCASGVSPAVAFVDAPEPYSDLQAAGCLWLIADRRGIAVAGLLEHMQHRIDARMRHSRATAAALQGAQATAVILSALPLAGLVMGSAMGAKPWSFLTSTALGQVMLVVGVGLVCVGFMWVERIVAGGTR